MKKATNKILSFLTAFAMVIGVLVAPFATASADESETTETVTLHKILMDKTTFDAFTAGETGRDGTQYIGNKIDNPEDFFGGKAPAEGRKEGFVAKEIPGVYFAVKYNDGENAGKYVTIKEEINQDPTFGAADSLDANLDSGFKLLAGQTEEEGIVFNTKGLSGKFLIEEIHSKSSYVGSDKETLTDMKAVPVDITLPLINATGVVKHAHVYPKNTQEKPETYKDFSKEFTTEQPNGRTDTQKDEAPAEPHNVGDVVDYTVTTKVPAKSKWGTAFWDDKMTEGLTFVQRKEATQGTDLENKGISVKYDDKEMAADWYTLDEKADGFTLQLTKKGLEEVGKATEVKTIQLDYSAVVNEKAVVAIPESNDVTFHYGNNENHGNTPVPNKPKDNGEMTVKKTWADGVPAAGEWAEFALYNAQTGKKIGTVRFETKDNNGNLETTTTYTPDGNYQPSGNEKDIQLPNESITTQGTEWSFKWTGLDKDIEYKVEEKNNMRETATYGKGENGELTVVNKKWNNPEPINPKEPKVVTYGAKFVKTNQDGTERLPNAEFVIKKKGTNEFLTGQSADRAKYEAAQTEYVNAIQAWNNAVKENKAKTEDERQADNEIAVTIGQNNFVGKDAALAEIKRLEKRRDVLWNSTLSNMTNWEGTSKTDSKNIRLKSNELGQFEVAGLAPGHYTLVEVVAPKDYALPETAEFDFEITATGSQDVKNIDFALDDESLEDNAMKVINKKVTIPQTGGIGSLIFYVAGAAIVVAAIVAMKRRNSVEA